MIRSRLSALVFTALLAGVGSVHGASGELRIRASDGVARLEGVDRLRIDAVSLAGRGEVDLDLERFDLLSADFRFYLAGRQAPVPDFLRGTRFFHGRVVGQPASRAVLQVWGDDTVSGAVEVGGRRYELDASGNALLAGEPLFDEPADLEDCEVMRSPASGHRIAAPAAVRPVQVPVGLYGARVLVQSDHEFFLRAGATVDRATRRLVDLFAQIAAIVEDEIAVRPEIGYLSIWPTPDDPWWYEGFIGWPSYAAAHPVTKYPRAFSLFISGLQIGAANLPGVCAAYGSQPATDLGWSSSNVLTAAHEVGHILGSDHTHCYSPPIDRCNNREEGCYDGPLVPLPIRESSLMSYCGVTSQSYGAQGRYGDHSERVLQVMRSTVELADARYPSCLAALTDALELRVESTASKSATLIWNDVFHQ